MKAKNNESIPPNEKKNKKTKQVANKENGKLVAQKQLKHKTLKPSR